jgi:hypothetical protein
VFNKLCEIVLGRGSVAPERLRNTPLDDISSLDHSYWPKYLQTIISSTVLQVGNMFFFNVSFHVRRVKSRM